MALATAGQATGRGTGRADPAVTAPVRVGMLLPRGPIAGWQRAMIMGLAGDPAIEIVLMVAPRRHRADGPAVRVLSLLSALDRQFARKILSGRFIRDGITPAMLDNCAVDFPTDTAFSGLRTIGIARNDVAAAEIAAADLDVVIDLDAGRLGPGVRGYARHGTWILCGEGTGYDAVTPLGFWEFYRNQPLCTLHLAQTDGPGKGRLVASGTYSTHRRSWSLNAMVLAGKAAVLVADAVKQLTRIACVPQAQACAVAQTTVAAPVVPGVRHSVSTFLQTGGRLAHRALHRLFLDERWRILLVPATPEGRPAAQPPVVIEPPAHTLWADPFVVRHDGRCCIFFEDCPYAERRGAISYIDITGFDGKRLNGPLVARRVLDAPHHLSYPFLFQCGGSLFMIPESSGGRSIDLWLCTEFPNRWQKVRSIMTGVSAVDTSLLHWHDRWWLFTNIDRSGLRDHCYELHVFHSDDPVKGTWTAHARNPVVVDAGRARMAGGFLQAPDGRPIRCCQVQGKRYGEALTYQLIETLSPTDYRESAVDGMARVEARADARHHHLACADGLFVADECRDGFKLWRLVAAHHRAGRPR